MRETIAEASNTEAPAYFALLDLGYRVERFREGGEIELWIADNGTERLVAYGPLALLGLYQLRRQRGRDWKASDAEIDDFLRRFYPDSLPH